MVFALRRDQTVTFHTVGNLTPETRAAQMRGGVLKGSGNRSIDNDQGKRPYAEETRAEFAGDQRRSCAGPERRTRRLAGDG